MPTMSPRQLTKAMDSLRPGDVLTNLACRCGIACKAHYQILVLARAGDDRYDFSVAAPDLNIVRDSQGPWRWVPHEQAFVNKDGVKHPRITAEVVLNEAGGTDFLTAYRTLPNPANARFRIDPDNVLGDFKDRTLMLQLEALLNRSDDTAGQAIDMQQAIDLIFAGSAGTVDERRMRYLLQFINSTAHSIAESNRPAGRSRGIEDLFGPGISIMGLGGLGGLSDLPDDMPPELREFLDGVLRSRRPQGGSNRRQQRGNGHDHGHPARATG